MLKHRYYAFAGKDENNHYISGTIDASNKSIAHYTLMKIGLKKINYLYRKITSTQKIFSLKIKEKHRIFFHLNSLVHSGLSIIDSINVLMQDTNSFKIKYLMYLVLKNLQEGHPLSNSFEKLAFNPLSKIETKLIKSSELSGNLENTLQFICKKLENKLQVQKKISSAAIYPIITLSISLIVTFIIFNYIIPQFEEIFSQNKHQLPVITKIIFSLSRNFSFYCLEAIAIFVLLFFLLHILMRYHIISNKIKEAFVLKTPIIGKIFLIVNRINFCYTLFMLLSTGIPIHNAFVEAVEHITLPYLKYRLKHAATELNSGRNISAALRKTNFLSRSAIQTIVIAENTGKLDEAFNIISQQYSNELSVFSDQIGKFIEPFIMIFLGGIIGTIVIAIYLPIFQLGSLY